jgi:hypothetical protein
MNVHIHDCQCGPLDRCSYCGCCQHCDKACEAECKLSDAPRGVQCPDVGCGCEGRS